MELECGRGVGTMECRPDVVESGRRTRGEGVGRRYVRERKGRGESGW